VKRIPAIRGLESRAGGWGGWKDLPGAFWHRGKEPGATGDVRAERKFTTQHPRVATPFLPGCASHACAALAHRGRFPLSNTGRIEAVVVAPYLDYFGVENSLGNHCGVRTRARRYIKGS